MTTRLCHVILVVVMWMQEIFQRHQEHLLNFIRIRLSLEVGVYKPYNWCYQCICLKAENKIQKLRSEEILFQMLKACHSYVSQEYRLKQSMPKVGREEEELAADVNSMFPMKRGMSLPYLRPHL